MFEGLSPADWLQLSVILGGGCITIGVIKSDNKNIKDRLSRIENFIDENFVAVPTRRKRAR